MSCAKFYQRLCFEGKSKLSNILAEWNNASVKEVFNCHFPTNTFREKPLQDFWENLVPTIDCHKEVELIDANTSRVLMVKAQP